MTKEILIARINERIKIYRDSPGMTVTYVDLAQTLELMLEVMANDKELGFKHE